MDRAGETLLQGQNWQRGSMRRKSAGNVHKDTPFAMDGMMMSNEDSKRQMVQPDVLSADAYRKRIKELEQYVASMSTYHMKETEEKRMLKARADKAEQQIDSLLSANVKLEVSVGKSQERISNLEKELAENLKENELQKKKAQSQEKALNDEIAKIKAENKSITEKASAWRQKYAKHKEKVEDKNKEYEKMIGAKDVEIMSLIEQKAKFERDAADIRASLEKSIHEMDTLKSKLKEYESIEQSLKEEISKLHQTVEEAETKENAKDKEISELKQRLSQQENINQEWLDKYTALETKSQIDIAGILNAKADVEAKLEEESKTSQSLRETIESLAAKVEKKYQSIHAHPPETPIAPPPPPPHPHLHANSAASSSTVSFLSPHSRRSLSNVYFDGDDKDGAIEKRIGNQHDGTTAASREVAPMQSVFGNREDKGIILAVDQNESSNAKKLLSSTSSTSTMPSLPKAIDTQREEGKGLVIEIEMPNGKIEELIVRSLDESWAAVTDFLVSRKVEFNLQLAFNLHSIVKQEFPKQ